MKALNFADDKLNLAKMMISVCDRIENIVSKGENAGFQHFLFSHSVFQSLLFGCLKSELCGRELIAIEKFFTTQ